MVQLTTILVYSAHTVWRKARNHNIHTNPQIASKIQRWRQDNEWREGFNTRKISDANDRPLLFRAYVLSNTFMLSPDVQYLFRQLYGYQCRLSSIESFVHIYGSRDYYVLHRCNFIPRALSLQNPTALHFHCTEHASPFNHYGRTR